MKNKIFPLFILTLIIFSSCGKKDPQEIELKLNLEKGKKYEMKITMENTIEMSENGKSQSSSYNMDLTMKYEVIDELSNGNFLIRETYESFNMYIMGLDMSGGMQKMIGEYVELEFTPQNKLVKTTLSPKLNELGKNPEGFDDIDNIVYPVKRIKVGETWESNIETNRKGIDVIMKTTSKLISVKNGIAEVQETGTTFSKDESDESYTGSFNANYKIEVATGLRREAVMDLNTEITTKEFQSPIKIISKVTMKML